MDSEVFISSLRIGVVEGNASYSENISSLKSMAKLIFNWHIF